MDLTKSRDVVIIIGSRPEAIKLFPVIMELKSRNIAYSIISTGQQRELLLQTLTDLEIVSDHSLELMTENQTPESFLLKAISEISMLLTHILPAMVVVQGDTASALAGAMSGYLNQIPVGHVEAGLRSGDLNSPWPEEGFRRMIDAISKHLWLPTAQSTMKFEADQEVEITGNTVVDALLKISSKENAGAIPSERYILVTLHRRESFGEALTESISNIISLAMATQLRILFIKHPNPNVERALRENADGLEHLEIIDPLPYSKFVHLLSGCSLLITDSGGLQEEATVLGIPTLIVRDTTERPEAITSGNAELIGNRAEKLLQIAIPLLEDRGSRKKDLISFGDGLASKRIVESIVRQIGIHNAN